MRRSNGMPDSSHTRVTAEAMKELSSRVWPGNVRELDNVLASAMIAGDGKKIQVQDLDAAPAMELIVTNRNLKKALRAFEKQHIKRVLAEVKEDRERCAKVLGISRSSLYEKLKELQINRTRPGARRVRKHG